MSQDRPGQPNTLRNGLQVIADGSARSAGAGDTDAAGGTEPFRGYALAEVNGFVAIADEHLPDQVDELCCRPAVVSVSHASAAGCRVNRFGPGPGGRSIPAEG